MTQDIPPLISTTEDLAAFIDTIVQTHDSQSKAKTPLLFCDMEGVDLGRDGSVSLLQIALVDKNTKVTRIIDVHVMQDKAFSTAGTRTSHTLRSILESDVIEKAFFDIRNDSDALFSHYQIRVKRICDIQLMECMTRIGSHRLVNGLGRCIESNIPSNRRAAASRIKAEGQRLFDPKQGGSYEIFNQRPLPTVMIDYCIQDVELLIDLWWVYHAKMSPSRYNALHLATDKRIELSHSVGYCGKGRHMALSGI